MTISKERIIEVKTTENPKRKGSKAFKQFSVLLKMNGKTVEDFLKQEGRNPSLDKRENWPMLELYYALRLGLVRLKKNLSSSPKAA